MSRTLLWQLTGIPRTAISTSRDTSDRADTNIPSVLFGLSLLDSSRGSLGGERDSALTVPSRARGGQFESVPTTTVKCTRFESGPRAAESCRSILEAAPRESPIGVETVGSSIASGNTHSFSA